MGKPRSQSQIGTSASPRPKSHQEDGQVSDSPNEQATQAVSAGAGAVATATAGGPSVATPAANMLGQIDVDNRSWWERNQETFSLRSAGSIYALLLLVAFFTIRTEQLGRNFYLGSNNVGNLLEQSSVIGMMAIGMTVLLISGNFDLSVASNAAMASMCAAMLVEPLGPAGGIAAGILVGTLGGLVNGLIHWYVGLNSFIVTLGTLTAYRGIVLFVNDGAEKVLPPEDRATLKSWAGEHIPEFQMFVVLGLAALAVGAFLLLRRRTIAGAIVSGVAVAVLIASAFIDYQLRLAHVAFYTLILLAFVYFVLRFTVTGRRLYATGGNRGRGPGLRCRGRPVRDRAVHPGRVLRRSGRNDQPGSGRLGSPHRLPGP